MSSDRSIALSDLKEKEGQILCLLVRGYTVDDMVAELHFSDDYVYFLIRSLKQHFHVKTPAAVVSHAIAQGIVSPDGVLLGKAKGL